MVSSDPLHDEESKTVAGSRTSCMSTHKLTLNSPYFFGWYAIPTIADLERDAGINVTGANAN